MKVYKNSCLCSMLPATLNVDNITDERKMEKMIKRMHKKIQKRRNLKKLKVQNVSKMKKSRTS